MATRGSLLCLRACLALLFLLCEVTIEAAARPRRAALLDPRSGLAVGLSAGRGDREEVTNVAGEGKNTRVEGSALGKNKNFKKVKKSKQQMEAQKGERGVERSGADNIVTADTASLALACNKTKDAALRSYFQNTVLVLHINYAWVAHKTAAFWRNVYGRLFKHIVILSDEDIPNLGVEVRSPEANIKDWRMCYLNLPKIMARYPDAEGFLWTNDDVVINYWNLVGADKIKLWMPNNPSYNTNIRWFSRDFKAKDVWDKDWPAASRWKKVMRKAWEGLDREYSRRYERNILPHKKEYPKRISDLFYVPRRFVEEFAFNLLPVFQMAGAPSELALPSMFYALDHPKNWDPVLDTMVFRWDLWEAKVQHKMSSFRPEEKWNASVSAFHPWKVSQDEAKVKLVEALLTADPCVGSQ